MKTNFKRIFALIWRYIHYKGREGDSEEYISYEDTDLNNYSEFMFLFFRVERRNFCSVCIEKMERSAIYRALRKSVGGKWERL